MVKAEHADICMICKKASIEDAGPGLRWIVCGNCADELGKQMNEWCTSKLGLQVPGIVDSKGRHVVPLKEKDGQA
jgi:hypothetical protein